ncbi:hypothetical protein RhiirA4_483884 [Rhizophagus irregularis]|uniref:Uncharacterized protein n=1 Tax=Rhizophagus irregularis TaxID=588596 RepID=A0A2I1HN59_9GLOM|nr:hypothetical protein RhiirA4_483884 [Rhizophagus irregularis]
MFITIKTIQASDFTKDQHIFFFKDIPEDRYIVHPHYSESHGLEIKIRYKRVNCTRLSKEVLDDIYSITNGYAALEGLLASCWHNYAWNTLPMKNT